MPIVNNDKDISREKQYCSNSRNSIKQKYSIIAICIAAIAVLLSLSVYSSLGAGNPFYVVMSESMVPSLNFGDIVVINRNVPFNVLKVGDIIVFTTPGKTTEGTYKTVVHRILGIETYGNHAAPTITTKGDANPLPVALMDYPIENRNYVGKVIFTIPKIGLLNAWSR